MASIQSKRTVLLKLLHKDGSIDSADDTAVMREESRSTSLLSWQSRLSGDNSTLHWSPSSRLIVSSRYLSSNQSQLSSDKAVLRYCTRSSINPLSQSQSSESTTQAIKHEMDRLIGLGSDRTNLIGAKESLVSRQQSRAAQRVTSEKIFDDLNDDKMVENANSVFKTISKEPLIGKPHPHQHLSARNSFMGTTERSKKGLAPATPSYIINPLYISGIQRGDKAKNGGEKSESGDAVDGGETASEEPYSSYHSRLHGSLTSQKNASGRRGTKGILINLQLNGGARPSSRSKEEEINYADPFSGASPSFQARLAELAALEADTIRKEKLKKLKKKGRERDD